MEEQSGAATTRRRPGAERLLRAASELFYQEGIRAIGVDTVSAKADVSKRTLYNRFGDKDGLVAAYLRDRDERWWGDLDQVTAAIVDPREQLLAIFDTYKTWLRDGEFRGCPFANATAEIADPGHPVRLIARRHKQQVKEYLAALTKEAGFKNSDCVAENLFLLLEGATATAAMRGSGEPFGTARSTAAQLLDMWSL